MHPSPPACFSNRHTQPEECPDSSALPQPILQRLALQPLKLFMAALRHRRRVKTAVFCASFAAVLSLPYIVSGRRTKQGQVLVQWMKTLTQHPCVLIGCLHIGPDSHISGSPAIDWDGGTSYPFYRLSWRLPYSRAECHASMGM